MAVKIREPDRPEKSVKKTRKSLTPERAERRKLLADNFPKTGKVRMGQLCAFLGIGDSTGWKYVSTGQLSPPQKYGARVSVWDAEYGWHLKQHGIPDAPVQGVA